MEKDSFYNTIKVEFENKKFNAPSCWKEYLTGLYGDYMQLPPLEKRKTHNMKAWYKKEK